MVTVLRVMYEEGDVKANAGVQVEPGVLDDPELVGALAVRLVPALRVFVDLERERVAKARKAAS